MAEFRPLILIPSFNTGPILLQTIGSTLATGHVVWLILDGSTDGSFESLNSLMAAHPQNLVVVQLEKNSGKGAAVWVGLRRAIKEGYTHVLCMDADGQHPPDMVDTYFGLSEKYPEAAIFGKPVFDHSAPALRVNGRKISNFWANLETLGWGIDDSLFGMRLYPAAALHRVMETTRYAKRFDFDPEVAVRMAWNGVPIINLPTPVRYPSLDEGGVSQFRYLRDNTLLTWMHLRLVSGFVLRLPSLIMRGRNQLDSLSPPNP